METLPLPLVCPLGQCSVEQGTSALYEPLPGIWDSHNTNVPCVLLRGSGLQVAQHWAESAMPIPGAQGIQPNGFGGICWGHHCFLHDKMSTLLWGPVPGDSEHPITPVCPPSSC
jgi:hypothetical protein